jgi:hypothetical protein
MSNAKPSFLRRFLKFLAIVFALGIVLMLGAVSWALWPQAIATAESWKSLSPHGALIVRFDPADAETASLIRDLAQRGGEQGAEWGAWFATRAIHPEITVLSFYDRATGDEEFGAAIQLRRLGNIFSAAMHLAAKDQASHIVATGDGAYRIHPTHVHGDEPFTHFMKQGIIVASTEAAAARISRFLRTADATGSPTATDRMRELFGRMIVEEGQVRGFVANDDQRIERLIEQAQKEEAFPAEMKDLFTPEMRQVLEEEFDGLLLAGELKPGDKLDLRVRLIFTSREAADAVEPALRTYLMPQLEAQYGEAAEFSVEREPRVVTVLATISAIRDLIRQHVH